MSEAIADPKLRTFVNSTVDNNFGLTVKQVAQKVTGVGRFSAWLNGNVAEIEKVLQAVEDNGVSPAFFASYEQTEGYNSQWGWLNHTKAQGNPMQDAISVSNWIKTQSQNTTDRPAWIDYANYKDFVPESVKQEGNEDFASMTGGTIGKVKIAGTAAATWETYYPDGLKREYNGVQDYAPPLSLAMTIIEGWGGVITNNGEGGTTPDPDPPIDPPEEPEEPIEDDNISREMLDKIFNVLLYTKSQSLLSNKYFKVEKVYANASKLTPTDEFYRIVKIEDVEDIEPEEPIEPEIPIDPEPEEPTVPTGDFYFPTKLGNGINFWSPPYDTQLTAEMDYGYARGRMHSGYDIGGGGGTNHTIYAVRDGKVTHVEDRGTAGYVIAIDHSTDEYHSLYMHLVPNSSKVNVGDNVSAGQAIATMGASGGNYAIHLHIEISPTGVFHTEESTINPRPYLKVTGNNKTDLKIPT